MFTERLNSLLEQIGANNSDIARAVGIDRTNISRFRNGKRFPKPHSVTGRKLVEGIYLYADSRNKLLQLCQIVGGDIESSADDIKETVIKWLYIDYEKDIEAAKNKEVRKRRSKRQDNISHLGERLNSVMNLAEMSNVKLSQMVHADASLISRYRNGIRTPLSNPELSSNICNVLFKIIKKYDLEYELSKIMNIDITELDEDTMYQWLYDNNKEEDDSAIAAENFLGIFDSCEMDNSSIDSAIVPDKDIRLSNKNIFIGNQGLQEAVIIFLTTALELRVEEILLYSDEDMEWMYSDHTFFDRWKLLMRECVSSGIHIKIIHNVDRDLTEMNIALKGWLPLYMSGMVTSYYCRDRNNHKFTNTIFLIPGVACIRSFSVVGSESETVYYYHREPNLLEKFQIEYEHLISRTLPLMESMPVYELPDTSDIVIVQSVLSLSTMPQELVDEFGDAKLKGLYKYYSEAFFDKLKNNSITECIPLADIEELESGTLSINMVQKGTPIYYTREQYTMHIRYIIDLLDKYENYNFYPISETPFSNTSMIISDKVTDMITSTNAELSFACKHPALCAAFNDYAKVLVDSCKIDRHTLKKMLEEKYL